MESIKSTNKAVLLILDGMGLAPNNEADRSATTADYMPIVHKLMSRYGCARLEASGSAVGLDEDAVGNSEVGHLSIGAGEVLPSTLNRIRAGYDSGQWRQSPVWDRVKNKSELHLVGLLSDAGVHAHWQTLVSAAKVSRQVGFQQVYLHGLLDGVDSQQGSALTIVQQLKESLAALEDPNIILSSIMGRQWAMDRSENWALTEQCCTALFDQERSRPFSEELLRCFLDESNESGFPVSYCENGKSIRAGDVVMLTNHRADRISQLAKKLNDQCHVLSLVALKQDAVPVDDVFFPTPTFDKGLTRQLKDLGFETTRISEQCKFPHVTFFIDGMIHDTSANRVELPTISDAEIKQNPAMSIQLLSDSLEALLAIEDGNQVLIVNVPNLDQVGHTGDLELTRQAARCVDDLVEKVMLWCERHQWHLAITADHGNADKMQDEIGRPLGSHSSNPVPLVIVDHNRPYRWRENKGSLVNVAASFLTILDQQIPDHFSPSLIELV